MSVRLTCCRKCTCNNAGITDTIKRLQGEHPDDLRVVEVKCMAACRQSPAVMVDYDFYPNVTPEELYGVVNAKLATETPLATELEDMLVS